jgi:hypothetical protein
MRMIENTPDRLAIRAGIPLLNPILYVFDKKLGTAQIERKVLFYLLETKTVLLKTIRTVHVVRHRTRKLSSYKPVLVLDIGHAVELPGFGRESSKEATRLLRDFLNAQ